MAGSLVDESSMTPGDAQLTNFLIILADGSIGGVELGL